MSDRGRFIIRCVLLGASALAVGAAALAIAILTYFDGDPFDRFEAQQSIVAPEGRLAVIYRHHHANSSNEAWAVWLINGPLSKDVPPARPTGEPAVVWFGEIEDLKIVWSAAENRFALSIGNSREARSVAHPTTCYLDYDSSAPCYDPGRIALVER